MCTLDWSTSFLRNTSNSSLSNTLLLWSSKESPWKPPPPLPLAPAWSREIPCSFSLPLLWLVDCRHWCWTRSASLEGGTSVTGSVLWGEGEGRLVGHGWSLLQGYGRSSWDNPAKDKEMIAHVCMCKPREDREMMCVMWEHSKDTSVSDDACTCALRCLFLWVLMFGILTVYWAQHAKVCTC